MIDVNIAHRTARTQDDLRRHVARAQPVLLNLVVGDGLARHGVHFAGRQPLDLVAVERKGVRTAPREVVPLVVVAQRQLDALVLHVAGLHDHLVVTRRRGQRRIDRLVVGVRTVVGHVEVDVVEETGVQADLPRLGVLRLEVVGRIGRRLAPVVSLVVERVGRIGEVAGESRRHLRIRPAHLEEGEPFGHVHHVGNHGRQAHRRIEERRVFGIGQLRSPVVAARHRQVEHRAPPHLDRSEDRLRLVVPPLLQRFELLLIVEVVHGEMVGQQQVARHAGLLVALVVDRSADVGVERPVVAEGLVDVEHHVAVETAVVLRLILVTAVRSAEGGQRRGVELLLDAVFRIIDPHAARNVHPVGDVPPQRGVEHVAPLARLAVHAVLNPIGVLQRMRALAVRPVLHHIAAHGVPALEKSDFVEVVAAREEVERGQRVVILALRHHVFVVLDDKAGAQVQYELVLGERGGIAGREVVAVVRIFGNDARRIGRRSRDIGLVLLVARRYRHRVDDVGSRVEELLGVERAGILLTPVHQPRTGSVAVLHVGQPVDLRKGRAVADGHHRTVLDAALGVDDHHAVGGVAAVKGRSRRAGQHVDRLDVFGVDIRGALRTGLLGIGAAVAAEAVVIHRNTVDHIEDVVALLDRLLAAHHHARAGAGAARTAVDLHAGHLADQRIHEVGVLDGRQLLGLDLLHVVAQGLLLTFDAEGRHHDVLHRHSRIAERNPEIGAAADGHIDRLVAQVGNGQDRIFRGGGNLQREGAVGIGRSSDGRTFDDHRSSDHRRAVGVGHHALHGHGPAVGLRTQNVFAVETVDHVCSAHHLRERFRKRARLHIDAHDAVDVHVLVRQEQIIGLVLDFIHHTLHADARQTDRHRGILSV